MKNSQLNRVINLVSRTGDKAIVMDRETDEVLVLMGLDSYENLLSDENCGSLDLDDELDDEDEEESAELNDALAPWEAPAPEKPEPVEFSDRVADDFLPNFIKDEAVAPEHAPGDFVSDWASGQSHWVAAEENLDDVPAEEEEKFYLEPVE